MTSAFLSSSGSAVNSATISPLETDPVPAPVEEKSAMAETPSVLPLSAEGLGAIRLDAGVGFRVWAPHAESVAVVGSFNDWNEQSHLLAKEEGGCWSCAVPEAKRGDEYRFILKRNEERLERIDPRVRKVTNSIGNGIVWWPEEAVAEPRFQLPPFNELIVYELHVGSFHATQGEGPGTFASVIAKLPYLKELGINAIEVMPIAEFAGDFSWGYNPAHPYAVESAYGGPDGFQELVKAAHDHGIGVILDVVYNHFGPGDLSLWQFDGWNENGLGGIYFYNDWKSKTPWADTRPDYGRSEVCSYIRDNAMMWLKDFGVDGLRVDMSVYIRTVNGVHGDPGNELADGWGLLQSINRDITEKFPGSLTIAEDLHDSEWLVKSAEAGGAGFGSQWDAGFVHPVRSTLIVSEDGQRSLDAILHALHHQYEGDAFKRVIYSESHDEVANGKARLPTEIAADEAGGFFAKKRSTLGAALTLTAPGIPMLFQGQEFLEDEWFRDEVPVDWSKLERFNGIHALYRDLIALRRNLHRTTAGLCGQHLHVFHINHETKVLAFRRWAEGGPGDDVIVLMNFANEPVATLALGVPGGGRWRVRLNSDAKTYSEEFGGLEVNDQDAVEEATDGLSHRITVSVGPYSVVILSQDVSA